MNSPQEIVLVTGSSGFLGSPTVERLAKRFKVIAMDRPGAPHHEAAAASIEVDLASEDSVKQGLRQVQQRFGDHIASVIHLAAYYDFSGEPSPLYEEITVRGTERLLNALKESFQVGQLVFSSSMLVHAPCEPGQRITEEWPIEAKWDYPKSKVKTEELLKAQHAEIPLVLLRIAGVYNDQCHSIPLANQIQRIRERWQTSHVFPGKISHGQAFLHLNDLIRAFERVTERRSQLSSEELLLVGEAETLSYDELQRKFGRLIHGEEWKTTQIPKAVAKTGAWIQDKLPFVEDPFIKPWMIDLADDHYELDISQARSVLDWQPEHSLRSTLPKMISALRDDPLGWYQLNNLKPPSKLQETAGSQAGKGSHDG